MTELWPILVTAIATGTVASGATVAALKVHILYLAEHNRTQDAKIEAVEDKVGRAQQTAERAHGRIDVMKAGQA